MVTFDNPSQACCVLVTMDMCRSLLCYLAAKDNFRKIFSKHVAVELSNMRRALAVDELSLNDCTGANAAHRFVRRRSVKYARAATIAVRHGFSAQVRHRPSLCRMSRQLQETLRGITAASRSPRQPDAAACFEASQLATWSSDLQISTTYTVLRLV